MNSLNSVLIEGNLTRDPELNYAQTGKALCKLSIASNRYYKKDSEWEKEVSFFDVVAWGRVGENANEYLQKGRGVRIVGRLKQDHWIDQNGNSRSKVCIVAEHIEYKPVAKKAEEQDNDDNVPF